MSTLPKIREHMDTKVPTLVPDEEITAAVRFLVRCERTGAPVVDGDGRMVGILTETDCLRLLTTGRQGDSPRGGTVADFMTREVVTVEPDADIYYVAGVFLRHSFRRLPVVEDGTLVGAITRFDLLRVVDELFPRDR